MPNRGKNPFEEKRKREAELEKKRAEEKALRESEKASKKNWKEIEKMKEEKLKAKLELRNKNITTHLHQLKTQQVKLPPRGKYYTLCNRLDID